MINKEYLKKVSKIYGIAVAIFLALSCISLLFKEWIIIPIVLVTSLFGFGSLVFYVAQVKADDTKKYIIFIFVRYVLMAIGIIISCLMVKATMTDLDNAKRYYVVCIGALPYMLPLVCLLLVKE